MFAGPFAKTEHLPAITSDSFTSDEIQQITKCSYYTEDQKLKNKKQNKKTEPSREKLEELIIKGTRVMREDGKIENRELTPYLVAKGRSATDGFEVTAELEKMMKDNNFNKKGQSLMYVVFRLARTMLYKHF